jgi:hypothetical protein
VTRRRACLVAAFLASGASALAHPPYEHNVGLIPGGDAGDVRLVKSFTDGIVLADPVTLVLRDAQGRTLAETPVAADISVLWPSKRRCLVFRFEHDAPLWPKDVWEVTGPHLTPRTSLWLYAIGPMVHVWNNAAEYLFVLLVPWASICGLIVAWTPHGPFVGGDPFPAVGPTDAPRRRPLVRSSLLLEPVRSYPAPACRRRYSVYLEMASPEARPGQRPNKRMKLTGGRRARNRPLAAYAQCWADSE